ncbi:NAD(P)-dependent oxidoreductase [Corynebacterium urealyticum]|nr:NAD(P)-dependent oxidoreductase [Corynebacterium urealyticum]
MPQSQDSPTNPERPLGAHGDAARSTGAGREADRMYESLAAGTGTTGGVVPGIVVLGAGGQLGTALVAGLADHAAPVVAVGRAELDLTGSDEECATALRAAIEQAGGRDVVVINAAAWTAVDAAEDPANTTTVERVNGTAPGVLAQVAAAQNAGFVHISTDYVFSGETGRPRAVTPEDPPAPVNEYGRTKLVGERAVLDAGGTVVRTAWVFSGPTGPGRDFLDTMAGLAERGVDPKVVDDQWGRPTFTGHLAAGLIELAITLWRQRPVDADARTPELPRLLHATGSGEATTWAGFAAAIFDATGHDPARVSRIPTAEYPTPARRPVGVYLDTSCWEAAGLSPLSAWQDGLRAALG